MKDIYELLNETNIDIDEFEEAEVSQLEKAKVKRALKKSLNMEPKKKKWKKRMLAAAIITGLSTATLGLTFPTYASNVPIIGDIFKFFDGENGGLYTNYKDYSSAVNLSQESNGITVTINDAIFDGKTVTITYSIETEKDLGERPNILETFNIKGASGMTGSDTITKMDETHYVGLMKMSITNHEDFVDAKIKWPARTIINLETGEQIKGKWDFAFKLNPTESVDQIIGQQMEQAGVKLELEKLSITPMSFVIYYNQEVTDRIKEQWHEVDVQLEIKDDLGNSYVGEGNGGYGINEYDLNWSATYEKLHENATKLIVTPRVTFRSHTPETFGGVELSGSGEKEITIEPKEKECREEVLFEDFIIDLTK